jgi:dienelactone hydrolase
VDRYGRYEQVPPPRQTRRSTGTGWRRAAVASTVTIALGAGIFAAARAATAPTGQPPAGPPGPGPTRSTRPTQQPPVRLPVGTIGRYQVAQQSLHYTRSSPAGSRPLTVYVRRPVIPASAVAGRTLARGQFPLVAFAPGFLQCQFSYNKLLNTWASAGYVVAAVQFPRTNCHIKIKDADENDLVNEPADVSYVIGKLLQLSAQPTGSLAGLIAPGQIAVAGHSDGGDVAAAVAANTCCADHRVKAALILSGAEWPSLHGRYFPRPSPPILFIQGSADTTWNPPAASEQLYRADTAGPRYYLDLLGVGHFAPYEGGGRPEPLVAQVTVDFLDRYLLGQPTGEAMIHAGDVSGEATLITGGPLPF